MPTPEPSDTTEGIISWEDVTDKWREIDVEWLQARSVLRFADETAANAASSDSLSANFAVAGGVAWINGKLGVHDGTSWGYIAAEPSLASSESGGTVTLSHASAGGSGVGLTSTGGVTAGTFAALSVSTTTLTVNGITVTGGSDLNVDGDIDVDNVTATGVNAGSGTIQTTGTVSGGTVNASSTSSLAAATATTLDVGATDIRTGYVHSGYLASSASGLRVTNNRIQLGSDATHYIDLNDWELRDGVAPNPATIAGVIEGPGPFNAADYPEGTIWIETP